MLVSLQTSRVKNPLLPEKGGMHQKGIAALQVMALGEWGHWEVIGPESRGGKAHPKCGQHQAARMAGWMTGEIEPRCNASSSLIIWPPLPLCPDELYPSTVSQNKLLLPYVSLSGIFVRASRQQLMQLSVWAPHMYINMEEYPTGFSLEWE